LFTEDGKTSLGTASRIRSAKVPVDSSDLLSASTARPGRNHAQGLPKIDQTAQQKHTITGELWVYSKRNQLRVHWYVLSQSTLALAATSMFSPSQGLDGEDEGFRRFVDPLPE